MVAYTAAAETGAGGASGVAALIDLMVARANATFISSRVGLRLRLVRVEAVAYSEPNNIDTDLNRLTNTSDGFLDGIHATRTAVGADLVTLLTETTGGSTSGLAWLSVSSGDPASRGFNVVRRAGCESTFIHEVGHNLGCEHDRENTSHDESTALYPYAFGHRFTPEGYEQLRTVMAYAPGTRVPYFSNPDVTYLDTPTGVAIGQAGQAHNARVIENTKAIAAAFRATAGNQPPVVALTHPTPTGDLVARDPLTLAATASDADGTVASVRFYQLLPDDSWNFSNVVSITLGADTVAPYAHDLAHLSAGYLTFAAVAQDDDGAISAHTVSVTVNPWYKQEHLVVPEGYGDDLDLAAINTSGQIAGTVTDAGVSPAVTRACRWTGSTPALLAPLPGDTDSIAHGITDDGSVYGESISGGNVSRAVRWSPAGSATDLSTAVAGQTAVAAYGADDQGRVLYETASGRHYRDNTALPINFKARSIPPSGAVGGYDYDFDASPNAWRAARWTSGGSSTLLAPVGGFVSSWGWSINRSGAVAGISSPTAGGWSSSTSRATFWAAGSTTPTDLAFAGSTASHAAAVNDHAEVVGYYKLSGDRPFLWRADLGVVPLREVVMPAQDHDLYYPRAIAATGQIAVEAFDSGAFVPVRLTPVSGLNHDYWQRAHFSVAEIEATGVAGDADDPDGDGRPNLLERAFGLDPALPESAAETTGYPQLGYDETAQKLTLAFRRQRAPTDLVYTIEATSDLAAGVWSSAGAVEVSRTALDADWDEVVYRSTASPAPGAPVFLRVRVGR